MRAVSGVITDSKFCFPFRIILAGSSESGKTRFAGELLKRTDIFEENPESIIYYYPCYMNKPPVNWHISMPISVTYQVGLPSKNDLLQLPMKSCVVLDDSYDEAIKSSAVHHLFRVISGKKQISVIIMTQNNFSRGKYGRDIRNSCNFSVLFRNCCDTSINENVARMAGLKKAFDSASLDNECCMYPYFFLDQSQKGQRNRYRLYSDIFNKYKVVYSTNGMKGYIIGAQDFELYFKVLSNGNQFSAKQHEVATKKISFDKQRNKKTDETEDHYQKSSDESKAETNDFSPHENDNESTKNGEFKLTPGKQNNEIECDKATSEITPNADSSLKQATNEGAPHNRISGENSPNKLFGTSDAKYERKYRIDRKRSGFVRENAHKRIRKTLF